MLKLTKKAIRSKMLALMNSQKEEDRKEKSSIIKNKLFKSGVFKKARTVMFYLSFGGEVSTEEMIKEAQKLGKIIAVPVCTAKRMLKPCLLNRSTKFTKSFYGVLEPVNAKTVSLSGIDLVVVPGLAFDQKRNRLGRGKGYYDIFLRRLLKKTTSLGLAFDFQLLSSLPVNTRDRRVDRVISN